MKLRIAVISCMLGSAAVLGAQNPPAARWFRGNLHAHSINSDGDVPPYELLAWYKLNGYQFLTITDHNTFTNPDACDTNPLDNFLLIGAEEVTNYKDVHVNAVGIRDVVPSRTGASATEILQGTIDAIRQAGGIPLVNHPNFRWAFTAKDMLPLKGTFLLEIASGHPAVNHAGNGQIASTEEMWDELLSAGMRVYAVAVDDSHNFRQEFTIDRANPGRAWVVVRTPSLTRENILSALDAGDFYASNGVELADVKAASDSLSVNIHSTAPSRSERRHRVVFIGDGGKVLSVSNDNPARYTFAGTERYVRARVEASTGQRAWTQPVFVKADR